MQFYSLGECVNCRDDIWRRDEDVAYRTKGRVKRFSCVKCGEDVYLTRTQPKRQLDQGVA